MTRIQIKELLEGKEENSKPIEEGMLWADSEKVDVEKKIERAIAHFEKKYQRAYETIYVNGAVDIKELKKKYNIKHDKQVFNINHFLITITLKDDEVNIWQKKQ